MANLTAERIVAPSAEVPAPYVGTTPIPIKASTKLFAGGMVGIVTNLARKGGASGGDKIIGIANETVDNTGADSAKSLMVRQGRWPLDNHATDPIAVGDNGAYCYADDDHTVRKTSNSGAKPVAGIIRGLGTRVTANDTVWVEFGILGPASPLVPSDIPAQAGGVDRTVRGVVTTNISLTNFTLAAADLTFVAGDRLLLTGQTSALENGIHVCGADGSGSGGAGTAALTRPPDFTGTLPVSGLLIQASEGTTWKDTVWFVATNGAITVDTTALTISLLLRLVSEEARSVHVVRGVVTTDVDPANFTLAAADLTFVAGDRVLCTGMTTGGANVRNGIYKCGADGSGSGGAGTATLTREQDWATGSAFGGAHVVSRAGTVGTGLVYRCTNTGAITVGTTATTFGLALNNGAEPATPLAAEGGKALAVTGAAAYGHTNQVGMRRTARNVITANVANLAVVSTTQDGLTMINGDRSLLVAQSTAAQNGLYAWSAIGGGNGVLTRVADMPSTAPLPTGLQVRISEGTEGKASIWEATATGDPVVDTTDPVFECVGGNWVQATGLTAIGTMLTPTNFFFLAAQVKPKTSGIFRVDVDIAFNDDTNAATITMALISDTVAAGALASANKVAHGVKGIGTKTGTLSGDVESVDTNAGAVLTYGGAGFTTAPITQKTETFQAVTGVLTAQAAGHLKFSFHEIVHNAIGTAKTPFTVGQSVAFGIKVTTATGTITVHSAAISVTELPAQ